MELLKNGLSQSAVNRIAGSLHKVDPEFKRKNFTEDCLKGLDQLELKERVNHIIKVLNHYLPSEFTQTASLLVQLVHHWDFGDPEDNLRGFAAWPIIDYFSRYGLEHPEESLSALKQLTHLFSAEFAIRAFIIKHPDYCQQQFSLWVKDKSEHVRRLVSEGTRPKLPWGIQLKQYVADPSPNIPLLDTLKADKSLYVRRSVANHLNDIAKDHPDIVIKTCQKWQKLKTKEIDWLIKHATRTLVKQGLPDVFALLGYTQNPEMTIESLELSNNSIKLGHTISFKCNIQSTSESTQHLVLDYALYFVKANGTQQSKVFKIKHITLKPKEKVTLEKSFSFKPITTRKYYAGEHKIELLINGKAHINKSFIVK